MDVDVDKEALANVQPLVDSTSTNLTTFSANGGKLIFYHGDSDHLFSALDTYTYYKDMVAANGGPQAVSNWRSSRGPSDKQGNNRDGFVAVVRLTPQMAG
jgi:hypothetical protein